MELVCERQNLLAALKRVRQNKGGPGIDGMTVKELSAFLKVHWLRLREEQPQVVAQRCDGSPYGPAEQTLR